MVQPLVSKRNCSTQQLWSQLDQCTCLPAMHVAVHAYAKWWESVLQAMNHSLVLVIDHVNV